MVVQGVPCLGQGAPAGGINAGTHKIQVSDTALARRIEAQGGRLIADYGGYQLYEVARLTPELLANTRTEARDNYDLIQLHTGHLNTRRPEVKALRKTAGHFDGQRLHLVQFAGPVQVAWREELLAAGARIVSYIPENTYLVYGSDEAIAKVQGLAAQSPHVQWEGAYRDDYKIHPQARRLDETGSPRLIGTDWFEIQLVDDAAANRSTLNLLDRLKLERFLEQERHLNYLTLVARLNAKDLALVAAQPEVVAILPYFPPAKFCERQDQIVAGNLTNDVPSGPGYLAWLTNLGFTQAQFTASGFAVDLSDSGIDNATTAPNHFGLYVNGDATNASRIVYNRLEGSPNGGSTLEGCDGHGNLNAHVIGGHDDFSGFPFTDTNGFHFGLGVCPFVKIGSSVIFDPDFFTSPNLANLQSDAYDGGARISNNSWGTRNTHGIYNSKSQLFDALVRDAQPTNSTHPADGNQEMVIVFAAGNDGGSGAQTVDSPSTAKNVITVGAADNVQLFGGSDRSGVSDSDAGSANEIAPFSSRGPCADGRNKPDILAPGTHVSGGVFQETNDVVNFPDGIADPCFDGGGVSGGTGTNIFWPDGQQFYTASSGTSHSAPCVSGGCALALQYFFNNFSNLPSPAMTKAFLLNSARYLTGSNANDTLPSPNQGMGEMNLGAAFDGEPRILRDEVPADLFTNSGQLRSFTGTITDTNHPFRVTLAWTDAPGSLSGNAWNNNLDLTVTAGGNMYKGNVFNGAWSVPGGAADLKNNVESVFLPAGISGDFVVIVTAANINSIGVPNTNNALNQDFALVIYNATPVPRPVMAPAGTTLVSENCTNGVIDPGETVTVNFALQNIGAADTSNVVATLQTNNGIVSVSGPQSYGSLLAASAATNQPFTFKALGACGGTITATLQLQDGATNLGSVSYNFTLGQFVPATTFSENFDGVTAPALPAGWTTSATGAESPWISSTNLFDTASNALFAADPDLPGLTQLVSPVIPIVTASAQLSFMNDYDLEAFPSNSPSPVVAYDGGVLEIAIGGGSFQDILQAGGSFVTGGYTTTVQVGDDNAAYDGRPVWSGHSGGFIQTIVNLPAAAAGHNIRLRWGCATDSGNFNGGTGWYIDSVSISDGYYTCCNPLVAPVILAPQISGTNVVFSFQSVAGQTYSAQYKTNLINSTWTTFQSLTGDGSVTSITNDATAPQRFYRLISP